LVRVIEHIGAFAGLAAFLGLAVLALLSFAHGRDIRRLRDWAGSAPERDTERKEATSATAAQRAEELRALEQSRTVEQEAIDQRQERRRRREAGLPELTRSERTRESLSGLGERLAHPGYLAAIFAVTVVVVGGAIYLLTSGSSEGSGKHGKPTASKVAPGEVEVTVLNGTAVAGLAASYGDKVEGKGFKLGAVTDSPSSFVSSVVMFKGGHAPEARKVAKQLGISKLEPMSEEIESASAGANVALIVGEDNAETAG
jgi:LytR cell envelope-related transcriptional attenuator